MSRLRHAESEKERRFDENNGFHKKLRAVRKLQNGYSFKKVVRKRTTFARNAAIYEGVQKLRQGTAKNDASLPQKMMHHCRKK